ncbi:MAG: hypothetical protein IJA56_06915 [Clostridia bacterium]|nr:hypothetical protein [Clostridia bacterium]
MISLWWPTLLIPAWMLLCGILGKRLKNNHHRSTSGPLSDDQQAYADRQRYQIMLIYSFVFAGAAAAVMRLASGLAEGTQRIFMFVVIMLETIGVGLLSIPVDRAVNEYILEQQKKGDKE